MALTDKQTRFVDEYLIDFNITQAAIRAGYSERSAHSVGWETLRNPEVAAAIGQRAQRTAEQLGITREYILSKLRDSAETNAARYVDVFDVAGNPAVLSIGNPAASNKAVELLMKHAGMLVDKVEHTGGVDIRVEGIPVNDLT